MFKGVLVGFSWGAVVALVGTVVLSMATTSTQTSMPDGAQMPVLAEVEPVPETETGPETGRATGVTQNLASAPEPAADPETEAASPTDPASETLALAALAAVQPPVSGSDIPAQQRIDAPTPPSALAPARVPAPIGPGAAFFVALPLDPQGPGLLRLRDEAPIAALVATALLSEPPAVSDAPLRQSDAPMVADISPDRLAALTPLPDLMQPPGAAAIAPADQTPDQIPDQIPATDRAPEPVALPIEAADAPASPQAPAPMAATPVLPDPSDTPVQIFDAQSLTQPDTGAMSAVSPIVTEAPDPFPEEVILVQAQPPLPELSEAPDLPNQPADPSPNLPAVTQDDAPQTAGLPGRASSGLPSVSRFGLTQPATAPDANPNPNQNPSPSPDPQGTAPSDLEDLPETADADRGVLETFAAPFDTDDTRPRLAIVLRDGPDHPVDAEALAALGLPVSVAISPMLPGAPELITQLRAGGIDVLLDLEPLMAGGQGLDAGDLEDAVTNLPGTVALIDGVAAPVQADRRATETVLAQMARSGHGLVAVPSGFNSATRLAARDGLRASILQRDLSQAGAGGGGAGDVSRILDRAAFVAGQQGSVVVVAPASNAMIGAIMAWALSERPETVALAPVSAALQMN